jgi:hypothetical protein
LYIIFQSFHFQPISAEQAAALLEHDGDCPDGDDDCKVVFLFNFDQLFVFNKSTFLRIIKIPQQLL